MPIRTHRIVPLALLAFTASTFAAAADESKPSDDPSPPVVVKVASAKVVDAGANKDDPRAAFDLVNVEQATCYAIAPSGGGSVAVGDSYAVVRASDIDDAIRTRLAAHYPKCAIVEVVARVTR